VFEVLEKDIGTPATGSASVREVQMSTETLVENSVRLDSRRLHQRKEFEPSSRPPPFWGGGSSMASVLIEVRAEEERFWARCLFARDH
jgi:hypothetical protein